MIVVEYNSEVLGKGEFWRGEAADVESIRNVEARHCARIVASGERADFSSGMWTARRVDGGGKGESDGDDEDYRDAVSRVVRERDEARRERDEARAKLAAAREWAAANKPFGGNGTINNEIHASMAEGDRLDAIISDAPALAVVEAEAHFTGNFGRNNFTVRASWRGGHEFADAPVTVVVMRKE